MSYVNVVWILYVICQCGLYIIQCDLDTLCHMSMWSRYFMSCLLQFSLWYSEMWHLNCLNGMGMYCSTLSSQYPILTSLGINDFLNARIYVRVCISSPPLIMVILL